MNTTSVTARETLRKVRAAITQHGVGVAEARGAIQCPVREQMISFTVTRRAISARCETEGCVVLEEGE